MILFTVIVLGAGFVLNWSWLVAVGIAPLLLAPRAAMCALGLCMDKKSNKSGSLKSGSCDQGSAEVPPSSTTAKMRDEA